MFVYAMISANATTYKSDQHIAGAYYLQDSIRWRRVIAYGKSDAAVLFHAGDAMALLEIEATKGIDDADLPNVSFGQRSQHSPPN